MNDYDKSDELAPEARQFAKRAKRHFDDSVERLDAATLSRLNRNRQAALAEVAARDRDGRWLRWLPATGLAAAAAIAAVLLVDPSSVELPDAADSAATDFEILLSDDSLEMIEDLEFYSWIETAEADGQGNVG